MAARFWPIEPHQLQTCLIGLWWGPDSRRPHLQDDDFWLVCLGSKRWVGWPVCLLRNLQVRNREPNEWGAGNKAMRLRVPARAGGASEATRAKWDHAKTSCSHVYELKKPTGERRANRTWVQRSREAQNTCAILRNSHCGSNRDSSLQILDFLQDFFIALYIFSPQIPFIVTSTSGFLFLVTIESKLKKRAAFLQEAYSLRRNSEQATEWYSWHDSGLGKGGDPTQSPKLRGGLPDPTLT